MLALIVCIIKVVINMQMVRRRHMIIIFLPMRKDLNLLTKKKMNELSA
ncbi:hypothetical protein NC653_019228 [Populus alba x Populus x berolinensis]|uniref:Uncharacterized protein n=1 Tax=Populus alba x Populus x berolinensis TaxID=444605 RepID=A0AAD6QIB4_9ROSI|nr:hypothetical protein NC653_019228 [Populus alba x Populus x berolinensis]